MHHFAQSSQSWKAGNAGGTNLNTGFCRIVEALSRFIALPKHKQGSGFGTKRAGAASSLASRAGEHRPRRTFRLRCGTSSSTISNTGAPGQRIADPLQPALGPLPSSNRV